MVDGACRRRPRHCPAAVLWDMDGTLVDTEPYWMECEFALAEKYGGTWSQEDALAVVGGDLLDSATYMREHMGIDRTPAADRRGAARRGRRAGRAGGALAPGARELLTALRAPRRAVRPGDDVLAPLRRAGAAGPARGVLRRPGLRRRGRPRQAAPRALPAGGRAARASPRRSTVAIEDSPTGASLGGGAPAAGCSSCPSHVPVPAPGAAAGRSARPSSAWITPASLAALRR